MLRSVFAVFLFIFGVSYGNPDAKRLYDDLLSNYNRLIRPVDKNNNTVLVKLGLRLSQLIDLVSTFTSFILDMIYLNVAINLSNIVFSKVFTSQ